jgi:hypothetical protein
VPEYHCRCGHTFPEALGKYGCPNCNGSSGAAGLHECDHDLLSESCTVQDVLERGAVRCTICGTEWDRETAARR